MLALLFFRGGSSAVAQTAGGKRRFKRRGRKLEFAFLEDIEDLLLFEGGAVEESLVVIAGEQSAQQVVQAEGMRYGF